MVNVLLAQNANQADVRRRGSTREALLFTLNTARWRAVEYLEAAAKNCLTTRLLMLYKRRSDRSPVLFA